MTSTSRTDDFIPDEPFVLIFIGMDIGSDFSIKYPADVYAAVHGYWRMNPGELVNSPGFLVLAPVCYPSSRRISGKNLGSFPSS